MSCRCLACLESARADNGPHAAGGELEEAAALGAEEAVRHARAAERLVSVQQVSREVSSKCLGSVEPPSASSKRMPHMAWFWHWKKTRPGSQGTPPAALTRMQAARCKPSA